MIFELTYGRCVPLQYRVAKPDLNRVQVVDLFRLPHSLLVLQAVKDSALGKDADILEVRWISITFQSAADTEKRCGFESRNVFNEEPNHKNNLYRLFLLPDCSSVIIVYGKSKH